MLFEDAFEKAVDPSSLPVGEVVTVTTLMGRPVSQGEVVKVYSNGAVQVRTSDIPDTVPPGGFQSDGDPIYNSEIYLFVVDESMPEMAAEDDSLSEADDSKDDGGEEGDEPEDDSPAQSADKAAKKKMKDGDVRSDARTAKAKIDVDRLPEDLKNQVMGIDELDEAQVDRIMSAISESAMKALKDVGVKDSEVFEKVVDIQKAVRPKLVK